MPRTPKISVQNNFAQGLITEATELSFPENACTETDNCVFESPGIVFRRLGLNFEQQFSAYTQDTTGLAITTFLWKNAAGEGDINFQVVQTGNTLHFYRVASDESLSANKHAFTLNLLSFAPLLVTDVKTLECQYSFGNGVLFVSNENLNSFVVEYNVATDTFSSSQINIMIRDTDGDPADGYAVGERPLTNLGSLLAFHRYNLENQGWGVGTALSGWDDARTDLPSNADVPWYFKNTSEVFDFTTVGNRAVGNSKAPRGHFIYNLYNVNRSAVTSGATDSSIDTARVSTSAFFAGRVFYSGLKSTGYSSRIWFSQIVENKNQYGLAYQTNDPTSEELFDLLPSDGGVIDLIEAGQVIKMVPMLNVLVVICSNGVWAISGSQGTGFAANDYTINKVSTINSVSASSFVDVEGIPFWWTLEGIYTVTVDPQTNSIRVVSISDETIRKFFDTVPIESRRYARGTYDSDNKVIQWIYRSTTPSAFGDRYIYDHCLNYNMLTKAWYPWSVSTDNVRIHGISAITGLSSSFTQFDVFNSADDVFNVSDDVVAFIATSGDIGLVIKYLVSYVSSGTNKITWGDCTNRNYVDWEAYDNTGEDYRAYFITGYALRGEAMKKFQSNYVQFYHDTRYDSQFRARGIFDFARDPNTGHWGTSQIVHANIGSRPPRIKIRGSGLVGQFLVESYLRNPFRLVGWAAFDTANRWI